MKKKILLLMGIFSLSAIHAQVGVNTKNPLGVFHLDAMGNNSATPTVTELLDDIVISNTTGNVGLGTSSPSTKLHIVTAGTTANPVPGFRLSDGTEGNQKVLTSDNNGVGTWQVPGFSDYRPIAFKTSTFTSKPTSLPEDLFAYTGLNIDFPQVGVYIVTLACRLTVLSPLRGDGLIFNDRPILQLLPSPANTSPRASWYSLTDRFEGSYEIMGIPRGIISTGSEGEYRFSFTQNLHITDDNKKTAYFILYINNSYGNSFSLTVGNGATDGFPQTQGGSFVRIK